MGTIFCVKQTIVCLEQHFFVGQGNFRQWLVVIVEPRVKNKKITLEKTVLQIWSQIKIKKIPYWS